MSRNTRRSRRRSAAIQRSQRNTWLRRYYKAMRNGVVAASIGAASLFSQPAYGNPDTWTGSASSNFNLATNWSGVAGGTTPITGDSLIFGVSGFGGYSLIDNFFTPATFSTSSITFTSAAAQGYTINASDPASKGFTLTSGSITNNSSFTETINDLIALIGSDTIVFDGSGSVTPGAFVFGNTISGAGSLTTSLTNGATAGTLTLSGANTYSGGTTLASGTTLNINNAGTAATNSAIGTGALTIAGNSTLNNTSGTAITLLSNNVVNLNADLTFAGSSNLSLGTGNVVLGGSPGTRTVTVSAGTLTTGPIGNAGAVAGIGLTVTGPGALTVANAGTNNIGGNLTVNSGSTLNMTVATTLSSGGAVLGSGTIAVGPNASANRALTSNASGSANFTGTLSDTFIGTTLRKLNFAMNGTGVQTLSGTLNYSGSTVVSQGILNLNSPLGMTSTFGPANALTVGNVANQSAILNISQDITIAAGQNQTIGLGSTANNATNANVNGAIYQTGGTFKALQFGGAATFQIGAGSGGYGYYKLSGGTLNANEIGWGGGQNTGTGLSSATAGNVGVMDVTGGTMIDGSWMTVGRGGYNSVGVLNMTGGSIVVVPRFGGRFSIGQGFSGATPATGIVNISNSSILGPSPSGGNWNATMSGDNAIGTLGQINLGTNGLFRISTITGGTNAAGVFVNFNGGTLQAAGSANMITNAAVSNITAAQNSGVYVYDDTALATKNTIDNNGFIITITNPLRAPTDFGISTIAVTDGGNGYVGAPAIVIDNHTGAFDASNRNSDAGATGSGATAVANMIDDGTGHGTFKIGSITVTNPGNNFGSSALGPGGGPDGNGITFINPTVHVLGGTNGTPATIGAVTTAANSQNGGMIFTGSGITTIGTSTLDAAVTPVQNTYGGPTLLKQGTLIVTGTGQLSNTASITVGTVTTAAKFVSTSTRNVNRPVTLVNGQVNGSGTGGVASLTVADLATNIVGNGDPGTLGAFPTATAATYTDLIYNGAGQLNPVTSDANRATTMINTTNLTTGAVNAGGIVTINPTNTAGTWSPGNYQLAVFTNALGQGTANLALASSVQGIGGNRQTAALAYDTTTLPGQTIVNLNVTGDSLTWTGATNTNWTTNPVGGGATFNWKLTAGGTGDDFRVADAVIFPDSLGAQTVNISDASVSAGAVVFNNNTGNNYTINASNPAFGISSNGLLRLNGTGIVTVNTANTFAGVLINAAGTLNIGKATALGNGPLLMNAAGLTIDNTSGSPVTLTNSSILLRSFTFTGTGDLSTGSAPLTATVTPTITVTNANATLTIPGAIGGGNFGITKAGPGRVVLAGNNSIYGAVTLTAGTLELTGTYTTGDANAILIGNTAATSGIFKVNGGTLNENTSGIDSQNISIASTVASSAGALKLTNSGTINVLTETQLANSNLSYAAISMDSGTFNQGSFFRPARGAGSMSVINQTGGTFTVGISRLDMALGGANSGVNAQAVYNISNNAILNVNGDVSTTGNPGFYVGNNAVSTAILNISGSAAVNVKLLAGINTFIVANVAGGTGVVNLNGGTLTVPNVARNGNGFFNFNGGTLKSNQTTAAFMNNGFTATVYPGGGTIDDGGNAITITQVLGAPTGNGVSATGLTFSGGGYIDTPVVTIAGGGGSGATAVANIDANGNLIGVTMTSPGNGYTSAPTFSLGAAGNVNGGIGNTGAIGGTATLFDNTAGTQGGITKAGSGTLTLSGANTFKGGLTLTNGTLNINNGTAAATTASAIGTGPFTITGGSFDNTSGGTIDLGTNNLQNWNANVVFGGTNALNMGTGAVTMNATRTVTTNGTGNLTVGGAIGGPALAGLNKSGSGRLVLAGTSTYPGPTNITQGKLTLSGAGSINSSSGITVSGGATFVQNSSVAVTPTVTVTGSGVDGNGTGQINTVIVADNANTFVNNGDGGSGTLRIGSLTFNGVSTMNLTASALNRSDAVSPVATVAVANNNGLTTGPAGKIIAVNASNPTGWTSGTYEMVGYAGAIQGTAANFHKGTITGLSGRATSALSTSTLSGFITLNIVTDTPIWTGALSSDWTTATLASPKNWKLQSNNAITDFLTNDTVLFDNSARTDLNPNALTVNLPEFVTPSVVTFSNDVAHPYIVSSTGAFGIQGTGFVALTGAGSVTLAAAASTYSGGTTLSSGTLNINNLGNSLVSSSSIGIGPLTINGGTLDNTDGGGTLASNNAQNWNGNFTFAGTSNLNMGTGGVTLGGTAGTDRTVTVSNNSLAVGPMTGSANLVKTGLGTLSINSTSTNNGAQSNITGDLNVAAGTFQIGLPGAPTASDFNAGGLTGSGTVENGSNQARLLIVNNATNKVFSGTLQDGAGAGAGGRLGFNKRGAGNMTLSGANTLSDVITVAGGQLILTGTINPSLIALGGANVVVGTTSTANGILTIAGGNLTTRTTGGVATSSLMVGSAANSAGDLRMTSGSMTIAQQLGLGNGAGGYAAMTMSGGTLTTDSYLLMGLANDRVVFNQSGGSVTVNSNLLTITGGGGVGNGAIGVVNLSGGTLTSSAGAVVGTNTLGALVGENGTGVLNVTGSGSLQLGGTGLGLGTRPNSTGIVNLLGGTVSTTLVTQGGVDAGGTGTLNFNGGVLQASQDASNLITGLANAITYSGGAKIDTNGHSVAFDQVISGATGSGISASGLTVSGGGYIDTPIVQITGGGGTGATAVANIDANGNLTGITMTCPGTGYTSAPSFSLQGGGIGNTGSIGGAATLAANVDGGLTKLGAGTLTMTGINTYTGPTTVSQGVLMPIGNAIASSTKLRLAGGTFSTNGADQILIATQLQVTAPSNIDLNNGGTLHLADSSSQTWAPSNLGSLLRIDRWVDGGSHILLDGTGLTGSPTTLQLSQIHFTGFKGTAQLVASGSPPALELVPSTNVVLTRGDLTGDGGATSADLSTLLSSLTDPAAYQAAHGYNPADYIDVADVNRDGGVDNADIQAEIYFLITGSLPAPRPPSGGAMPVPEPSGVILLGIGGALYLLQRYRRHDG